MSKVVFDGVGEQPELNRITAKKNYASSSQSHKMGATAMFNDILHHLAKEKYPELLNEVGGLVAVRQHPVYAFQKIPIEGTDQYTHKFIGLFTVGADKGDKNFFGFSDSEIKKTAIRLEGVDHIKGVGFNYPWEVNGVKKIRYNAAKEALCIVTDSDPTKWIAIFEQSMAGVAETEAEIDAYLAEKWQPAFECAYYNNPLIVGVDMTLAEINANIEAFGNLRRNDDRPYSMCEFWIDGEYDVYYLDKETNRYEKNGINILTDLGIAEGEITGLTIEEKNALFIQKRVERFREQAKEHFNVTDSIYQLMFLFIILATDNFEKNMYPYLMALLWRFLQDDLDSIFSTDNQGLDTKKYSTELHDFTDNSKSAYVFKGEDSAFWQLIELAFPNECKQMGRDILQAMYDKASGGTTTTEKLLCFFDDYFFDRAQNYFTPSAYNDDTEYAYEEAWNNKEYVSSVDIHPLAQALGSHESTERAWLEKRIIYLQSKFSFGSFASSGSDLGVISFRTQQAQSFTLTPAIDCYPTIVSGDGNVINAKQRVMAGESVTLEGAGGSNTNVYIVGADWLSDIGDLKGLALDPSAVQKLSISSKRLRRIKVGDEVASEVTSALQQLDIQRCDCLETIDARNLTSLVGVVDLSKCPRLSEAYFGGSSASAIVIAAGSKIEKLELPDTISVLDLRDTKFLQEINIGELANLNSLRLEGVPSLDGFEVLSNAYNAEGQKLQSIRLIGFTRNGNSDDLDMLSNLANDKDKDGNEHPYNGIDAQGKPTDGHPVLEGTLNIDGYVYEDAAEAVRTAFPSIVFTPKGFYVSFADPEVQRIVASNWGDGKGITSEQVKAITDVGTKFQGNTLIETFDEFEKFEGVTSLGKYAFNGCTSLKSIDCSNIKTFPGDSFDGTFKGCSNLENVGDLSNVEVFSGQTFYKCKKLNYEGGLDSLKTIGRYTFRETGIKKLYAPLLDSYHTPTDSLNNQCDGCELLEEVYIPSLTKIKSNFFYGCKNLTKITTSPNLTDIEISAFQDCISLNSFEIPNTCLNIGTKAFLSCKSLTRVISYAKTPPTLGISAFDYIKDTGLNGGIIPTLEAIYVPDASVEAYQSATNWVTYKDRIKSIFYYLGYIDFVDPAVRDICVANFDTDGDGKVSMEEAAAVTDIGTLFRGNTEITSFNEFKYFTGVTTLKSYAFERSSLEYIKLPSSVTLLQNYVFANTNVKEVIDNDNITRWYQDPFKNCTNITHVVMPKKLTGYSGDNLFEGCSNIETITFSNSNVTFNANFLPSLKEYLINADSEFCNNLFSEDGIICKLQEPWIVICVVPTKFSDLSFVDRIKAKHPNNSIIVNGNKGVFAYNPNLKKADIRGLTWPSTLNYIFYKCSNLKEVWFDGTVSQLWVNCFADTSIEKLVIQAEKVITNGHNTAFSNTPIASGTGYIYVPDDLVDDYKAATNWNQYANQIKSISEMYIEFEDSEIERICVENFDVDEDGKLTIGEAKQVTDIGTIFQNNTSITKFNELEYFKNVTELAAYAFHESSLSDINLNNISSLKGHTFRTCKNLRKLVFKNCVSITGFVAFYSNVETAIFKNGWIDNRLGYNFSNSKLTSLVVCGGTISSLHTTDLENTPIASGAGYIYVPDNLVNDYKAATNWNAYASQIKPLSEYVES